MSKIENFPYPTHIPAKIWGCSFWSRSVMLGSAESEMVNLISREIIFAEFQPIWSRYLNVTDRQTDGRTTCHGNTALRVASRGKNGSRAADFIRLLSVHIYAIVQIFVQLSSTLTKLCHIKCDTKRAFRSMVDILSTLWWSRLIWHNFVKVAVNWIKISML